MRLYNAIQEFLSEGIVINTRNYEASHGKKPRGSGGWAFSVDGKEIMLHGSYTECLNKAKSEARKLKKSYVEIKVMP